MVGTSSPDDHSPHQSLAVSRRRLLLGAGAAAVGAAAYTGAGTADAAEASGLAETAAIPSPDDLPLTGGPDFPIGIFWPPHPYASTPARYQEIADAGFNFLITGNYAGDGNIFMHQLGLARDVGLKVLISDDIQIRNMSRWFSISDNPADFLSVTPAEARELFTRARNAYGPFSSLAGFNYFDEPGAGWFATLARAVAVGRELAPQLLPYINLFPSTDPNYYQRFVDVVKPSLVSFDKYPLLTDGRDDPNYFLNWAIVRKAAQSIDVPSWIFIQTLAYRNHRTPTAAEMLWQINVSLAYGAKGIQYFTYWTPEAARGEEFQSALITVDGERTERYAAARKINTGWLPSVGKELKPLVSESVTHANDTPLPAGAVAFTPNDYVQAVDGGAVVLGQFHDREASATRWLLVANRDHSNQTSVVVRTQQPGIVDVARFVPDKGSYVPEPDPASVRVDLTPGAATLLRLNRA